MSDRTSWTGHRRGGRVVARDAWLLLALLLSPIAAHATSPEAAYLAARDRDIAALAKIENAKDTRARDRQYDKAVKDLERRLKDIVGPFAVAGFPADGKLNIDSLYPDDQGFGMLDGLIHGEHGSDKNVLVTTENLLDLWLRAKAKDEPALAAPASEAVKTESFYTFALSPDAAVVHYAAIPIAAPAGAKLAYATLSARTQDQSPNAPDELFVVLEKEGRVFVADEKLATPIKPIPACDAVRAGYTRRAEAADKAYADGGAKDETLADAGSKIREKGDIAFRACFGAKVKGMPQFKAAKDQVAAVIAAFGG